MNDWNYEAAKSFVTALESGFAKDFTTLLFHHALIKSIQGHGPEGGCFDFLFFVKTIFELANDKKLIEMCLNGEAFDLGWEAIADAIPLPEREAVRSE